MKKIVANIIMHTAHKLFLIAFSPVILPLLLMMWCEEEMRKK
jgi:hypothetical protein